MNIRQALFFLLLLPLLLSGCSNSRSDGDSDPSFEDQSHLSGWIKDHSAAALAKADFADCTSCHGADLMGSGEAVSCYSCHSYNTTPPFVVHPPGWTDPYADHRGYAATNGTDSCTKCHGDALEGSFSAPSCFTASFDGLSCHADGPGQAPHSLDGSYLEGSIHGPDAKADLTACQQCHGQPGGPGSNPRFNIGIDSAGGTGCEACHGINYAHPAGWAGPNATFHYSAGNLQSACTLCHGVNLDGVDGVGGSCLNCHAETTSFRLDCTACHGSPPDGSADVATTAGVPHGNVAGVALHDDCVVCHGMKESASGGNFSAVANYALFNKTTDTIGSHWDGNIDMNGATGYNQTNFGCDIAGCHGNNADHQLSGSGLPVVLGAYGQGKVAPHPLDGSFLLPANHGPAAKGLTAAFPNGIVDCQACHGEAGGAGSNPRFNVGIISAGGMGCEGCHNDFAPHPSVGSRENVPWYDVNVTHSDANDLTSMCALCHGASLGGGVGPACSTCHPADPLVYSTGCVSCHNLPPSGIYGRAGDTRPNRLGRHNEVGHVSFASAGCSTCHNNAGFGTARHFDTSQPADVALTPNDAQIDMTSNSNPTNTTCLGSCHGIYHDNLPWY